MPWSAKEDKIRKMDPSVFLQERVEDGERGNRLLADDGVSYSSVTPVEFQRAMAISAAAVPQNRPEGTASSTSRSPGRRNRRKLEEVHLLAEEMGRILKWVICMACWCAGASGRSPWGQQHRVEEAFSQTDDMNESSLSVSSRFTDFSGRILSANTLPPGPILGGHPPKSCRCPIRMMLSSSHRFHGSAARAPNILRRKKGRLGMKVKRIEKFDRRSQLQPGPGSTEMYLILSEQSLIVRSVPRACSWSYPILLLNYWSESRHATWCILTGHICFPRCPNSWYWCSVKNWNVQSVWSLN